jgi:alpha-L-fucosidase
MNWKSLCCVAVVSALSLMLARPAQGAARGSGGGPVRYEPNWESLDARPTPEWYLDAKFGIFIHWGVYSVPAWGPKDAYSEWYWFNQRMRGQRGATAKFHEKNYGKDFDYQDFAPMFKAELFEPAEWADTFVSSGAKYVVLTSKHHDGFCLWPSEDANRTWGRPWNSVDVGPKRDLLGDLTEAVRARDIKMGFYYSLYEWFNPLWRSDRDRYVEEHMHPQFKDVVTRYRPSIIFSDGEWDMPAEKWRSAEFLAWLFNESPCRDEVVINDRWGKGSRHKHGGYYTTEYGAGLAGATHPWEECRGIGYSFGYNRNEPLSNYKSARELLLVLVDLVSRGGNLLLDIGPTADARIPTIMQDRLIRMGDWLQVNGEAIYGTRAWKRSCQWTDGDRPDQEFKEHKVEYNVLDTVGMHPKNGRAVKQVFFTSKPGILYAITPGWPGKELVLKDITPSSNTVVTMLGVKGQLKWEAVDGNLVIQVPQLSVDEVPCLYAYSFKVTGIE